MKSLMNSHLYFRYMNSQIEFIEFNLIIFCDGRNNGRTLGLLESLDLSDRETKNHSFLLFGFFEKIINEFTNEFIELNLIIFCDKHTDIVAS